MGYLPVTGETTMSLTLHFHPPSSFCQKALIALYENDIPFEPHIVNLFDEAENAAFKKLWPIGRFPVLRDESGDRTVPESSIIIEYLAQHYPGGSKLVPADDDLARRTRLSDRFFDLYVNVPVGKVVTDRLRPAGRNRRRRARLKPAAGIGVVGGMGSPSRQGARRGP
jgi:glutathione S-transferase